jgi:4-hydroxyphenylpyruvate dioxygenase
MQFTPWDNPMGTDGFEFIEYAAPDPAALGGCSRRMGFRAIARHRHKNVLLYRQGEINFIINAEPDSASPSASPACTGRASAPSLSA